MKSITTKYLGCTDTRGSRISVTDGDTRILVAYDDDRGGTDGAHDKAVLAFCQRLNWTGTLVRGHSKTGNVYVFLADGYMLNIPGTPYAHRVSIVSPNS